MDVELENVQLFQGLNAGELAEISTLCTRLELTAGDVLISEHDEQADLFILCKGNVEIVSGASATTSSEIAISESEKNIFGEINWLLRAERTATVRCVGDVDAIRIDGQMLMRYLEKNPGAGFPIMRRIAKLLANRLKQSDILIKQILWNMA